MTLAAIQRAIIALNAASEAMRQPDEKLAILCHLSAMVLQAELQLPASAQEAQ